MNTSEKVYDAIVIGGGPAGASAAIYLARAGHSTIVLDKGISSGALGMAERIVNYPGIPGPVSGADIVNAIRSQAQGFGATFITDKVIGVDLLEPVKTVYGNNGEYRARVVVLATGSMGRQATIQGEKNLVGRGVSYCATCDGAFYKGRPVAVVGNNDEAVEEALFLTRFASRVFFICPTRELKGSLASQLLDHPNVQFSPSTTILAIEGERTVEAIRVRSQSREERIAVDGVFVYLQGARPVTDFLGGQVELAPSGCVKVDSNARTSVPGVFAVGDLVCARIRQAVIAAADGVVAAMSADMYLRGAEKVRMDWAHA